MRKIHWNPKYKNADQQQDAFIDEYLSWLPTKKWKYLMELAERGTKRPSSRSERRIEWK